MDLPIHLADTKTLISCAYAKSRVWHDATFTMFNRWMDDGDFDILKALPLG